MFALAAASGPFSVPRIRHSNEPSNMSVLPRRWMCVLTMCCVSLAVWVGWGNNNVGPGIALFQVDLNELLNSMAGHNEKMEHEVISTVLDGSERTPLLLWLATVVTFLLAERHGIEENYLRAKEKLLRTAPKLKAIPRVEPR